MNGAVLFTVGYEGWGFDLWIESLCAHGVRTVVDVRELPLSRRPGWSKRALAEKLAERGFGYVHIKALGSPAPLRHALRDGVMSFDEFAPRFRELLETRVEDLDALLQLAQSQPVALMCWEEDPARCHRSLVAKAVVDRSDASVEVEDIRRISSAI